MLCIITYMRIRYKNNQLQKFKARSVTLSEFSRLWKSNHSCLFKQFSVLIQETNAFRTFKTAIYHDSSTIPISFFSGICQCARKLDRQREQFCKQFGRTLCTTTRTSPPERVDAHKRGGGWFARSLVGGCHLVATQPLLSLQLIHTMLAILRTYSATRILYMEKENLYAQPRIDIILIIHCLFREFAS